MISSINDENKRLQNQYDWLKDELDRMFEAKLYSSVLQVALLQLKPENSFNVTAMKFAADSLFELREFRRALKYYQEMTISTDNHIRTMAYFKSAKCLFELKDFLKCKNILLSSALSTELAQNFEYLLLCAKCCESCGDLETCLELYLKISNIFPLAFEIHDKVLLKNAEPFKTSFSNATDDTNSIELLVRRVLHFDWLMKNFRYEECKHELQLLLDTNPSCLPLLQRKFLLDFKTGDIDHALDSYGTICLLDDHTDDFIGELGMIYLGSSDIIRLNKLVHSYKNENHIKWYLLALWCEAKSKRERAISFLDQSLIIKPDYRPSFLAKGRIFKALARHKEAFSCFKKAHKIEPDVYSFENLLSSLLALNKPRDALQLAKDFATVLGNMPRALVAIGKVLEKSDELDKAKRAYESAISKDSLCIEAVLALVELMCTKGDFSDALNLLEKYKNTYCTDWLFVKLGDVCLLLKEYVKAFYWYHSALGKVLCFRLTKGMNPECEKAKEGILRVEKIMRGEDESEGQEEEGLDEEDL